MTIEQLVELKRVQRDALVEYWISNTFLQWEWWVLLVLTIIPWVVWWMLADKKRIYELLTYGLLMAVVTVGLDSIGTNMVWWTYPHELFSMLPPLVPVDLSIIPCAMMVVYQYFDKWQAFFFANLALALFSTFVGEELFIIADFF
ncbi:CBO0543 family protein [Bacillus sp. AK031]